MASIYMADDKAMRAREGIRYDFVAPDGSESRDAAAVIYARNTEFLKGIKSSDDYLDFKLAVEALSCGTNTVILDDRGLPSVMVLVPKMNSADLSNGLKSRTHPGFIVGGREYELTVEAQNVASVAKSMAEQERDSAIGEAQALHSTKVAEANTAVAEFMAGVGAYNTYSSEYKYYKYLQG